MRKPLVRINWEEYENNELENNEADDIDEQINEFKEQIWVIIRSDDNVLELNDDELIPRNNYSLNSPSYVADTLISIIKFLENNNIPWEGMTVPFMDQESPGFFIVNNDEIIIAYLNKQDNLDKEHIPLPVKRKI